jgi:hypothetical protein
LKNLHLLLLLAHERTWETFSGRGAFITAFTFCWDLHVQTQLADLMTTELDSFFEEFALTAVGSETMFTKSTENFF